MEPTVPELVLANGSRWPCPHGSVIGRRGSVAVTELSNEQTLSRRHLKIEQRSGTWFITQLPEARNLTWFDREEMRPGIACRINGRHELQVSRLRMELVLQPKPAPSPLPQARTSASRATAGAVPGLEDATIADGRRLAREGQQAAAAGEINLQDATIADARRIAREQEQGREGGTQATGPEVNLADARRLARDPSKTRSADRPTNPVPATELRRETSQQIPLESLRDAPAPLFILNDELHCLWASREAGKLLGCPSNEVGDFLERLEPATRDATREALKDLRIVDDPIAVSVRPLGEDIATEIRFLFRYPHYLAVAAHKRIPDADSIEVTQSETIDKLTVQGKTLALFSLSRSFQEGDLPKAISLVTVNSREAVDCARVTVWLTSGEDGEQLVCTGSHGIRDSIQLGTTLNLNYCPDYFERVREKPYLASERGDSPILPILREIGFIGADSRSVLTVAIQLGETIHGMISFERCEGNVVWSEPERHFALSAASFCLLALQTQQRNRVFRELREKDALLQKDIEEATMYFRRILPQPLDEPVLSANWAFEPCEALGGDAFGYHWIDDEHFAMYVIDVVGHGSGAALLSVSVMNALRSGLIPTGDNRKPAEVVAAVNRSFQMEEQGMLTFTMWYGVYNKSSRRLAYSSAGHPPAILLEPDSDDGEPRFHELSTEGLIIGGLEEAEYDEGVIDVGSGEAKLFVFTDGAFEIPLSGKRLWSFEEFVASVRSTQHMEEGEPDYLLERARAICAEDRLPDDFCMVRFLFKP